MTRLRPLTNPPRAGYVSCHPTIPNCSKTLPIPHELEVCETVEEFWTDVGYGYGGSSVYGEDESSEGGNTGESIGRFTSIGKKLTESLKVGGILTGAGDAYEMLINGVRNLIPSKKDLAITRILLKHL